MKNSINILEDKFYYKGKEYTEDEIRKVLKNTESKMRLNIISSNLFIKKYDLFNNKNYEKFIEEKINLDFHEKNDFLFHYEILRKQNNIYLYAIRSDKFKFIYKNYKEIDLIPIQFTIIKYISKKYKKIQNLSVIYKFNNKYDLINVKNKLIEDFISFDSIDNMKLYIEKNIENNFIIIDKNLENLNLEKYNCVFNLKEEIYEKIYKV